MPVEIVSVAAPGHPNEDFAAANASGVVLVDGAGLAGVDGGGCAHGVAWYARSLGTAILDGLHRGGHLAEHLADAIGRVADAHRDTCDLGHPGTPSATVLIARLTPDHLDHLVLADSTMIVRCRDGSDRVVTDDREETTGPRVQDFLAGTTGGSPEHYAAHGRYVAAMRPLRNRPGGFWVAAADPTAAAEALTGRVPTSEVRSVALFSDGAARMAEEFGLHSWSSLMAAVIAAGPAEVIRATRDAERSDPTCARWPRGKVYDDATIAYLDKG